MADPDHTPDLDPFDQLTVTLYRAGLASAAIALLVAAVVAVAGGDPRPTLVVLSAAVMLSVANLHLYDKKIRWVVGMLGAGGPVALGLAAEIPSVSWILHHAGFGLSFAALSALALKEGFCFKVPGVRLVPVFLATSLVPLLTRNPAWAGPLLGLAGVVVAMLFVAKVRMPLGHDIGDRSHYQV